MEAFAFFGFLIFVAVVVAANEFRVMARDKALGYKLLSELSTEDTVR